MNDKVTYSIWYRVVRTGEEGRVSVSDSGNYDKAAKVVKWMNTKSNPDFRDGRIFFLMQALTTYTPLDKEIPVCNCGKAMSMHYDSRDNSAPFGAVKSHPGTLDNPSPRQYANGHTYDRT